MATGNSQSGRSASECIDARAEMECRCGCVSARGCVGARVDVKGDRKQLKKARPGSRAPTAGVQKGPCSHVTQRQLTSLHTASPSTSTSVPRRVLQFAPHSRLLCHTTTISTENDNATCSLRLAMAWAQTLKYPSTAWFGCNILQHRTCTLCFHISVPWESYLDRLQRHRERLCSTTHALNSLVFSRTWHSGVLQDGISTRRLKAAD